MVRTAGLEPAWPIGRQILSLLCIPIPPRPLSRNIKHDNASVGRDLNDLFFRSRFDNLTLNREKYAHRAEYTGLAD